jgi:hypothetical protein
MLVFMRKRRIKFVIFILGCVLKYRTLLNIRNTILLIICSSFYVGQERIAGSPTNENEDLLHASFNIYGPIQDCYTFGSSFLDNEFDFTTSFHVVDTFYNSVSCYGPE